jgi:hypothetical protein
MTITNKNIKELQCYENRKSKKIFMMLTAFTKKA